MDGAQGMGGPKTFRQPAGQAAQLGFAGGDLADDVIQAVPIDIFGDDVDDAQGGLLSQHPVLHQGRVGEAGQGARLLAEHGLDLGILGQVRQDHLDGHPFVGVDIDAFIDLAHAAPGDEAAHLVDVIEH